MTINILELPNFQKGEEMIDTNCAPVFRYVFFAIVLAFLFSSPLAIGSQTGPDSMGGTGSRGASGGVGPEGIPALDQAPPSSYETATFGLG